MRGTFTASSAQTYWLAHNCTLDVISKDPVTAEEDGEEANWPALIEQCKNEPSLPLWMILKLPAWIVDFCFWSKKLFRRRRA
jgi:hypothetical protein